MAATSEDLGILVASFSSRDSRYPSAAQRDLMRCMIQRTHFSDVTLLIGTTGWRAQTGITRFPATIPRVGFEGAGQFRCPARVSVAT